MHLLVNCKETPGSSPSVVGSETGIVGPHVRGHLAVEARRFEDGRLRLYKYTPATEHMLIQCEREGPQHGQEVGEVAASEKGVRTMLSYRIGNETCFKRSEQ